MKRIWKHIRDSKLRWILILLGGGLGMGWEPAFGILTGSGVMIILIDTGERFYRGLKGAELSDER